MKLLVMESRNHWAAAIRRLPAEGLPRLHETRTLADCAAELAAAPQSFVVLELTSSNAMQILAALVEWRRRWPQSARAVVGSASLRSLEGLMVEAGAALALFSPGQLAGLLAAVARHAVRYPQPAGNFAEQLWADLPLAPPRQPFAQ